MIKNLNVLLTLLAGGLLLALPSLSFGSLYAFVDGGKWGFIDQCGRVVIPAQFSVVMGFHEGLSKVLLDREWEFINLIGKTVFTLDAYSGATEFHGGRIAVQPLGGGTPVGFASADGRIVIQPKFERAKSFSEGLAGVKKDGKWFFIDTNGKKAFDESFDDVGYFSEGLAPVRVAAAMGFIDHDGEFLIQPRFDRAESFHNGLAAVCSKGRWGYVSRNGSVDIAFKFDDANGFQEGLAAVKVGFLWGYIDKSGRVAITCKFRSAGPFSQGLAGVEDPDTWRFGYIDKLGSYQIPASFALAYPFSDDGIAKVGLQGKSGSGHGSLDFGYVDRAGAIVWSTKAPERQAHYSRPGCPR